MEAIRAEREAMYDAESSLVTEAELDAAELHRLTAGNPTTSVPTAANISGGAIQSQKGVALQRAPPPVTESGELVPVFLDPAPHQRADGSIQPRAVTAPGQHSDSHRGNISRHECPRD